MKNKSALKRSGSSRSKHLETLYFPGQITVEIGLPVHAINAMKHRGCKFFGKKTTIRWVREFVEWEATPIRQPAAGAAQPVAAPAAAVSCPS
ncbi:MAG TPA: hypothetical protein VK474_11650 [Chthoniobacterales bacterium]|nr:hypothetical protein [Chthoniobacterales bacterium]